MDELEEEIEELRSKNEALQREMEVLQEQRDFEIGQMEAKMERMQKDIEKEWKTKLGEMDRNCRKEVNAMAEELDVMRAAFSGDASGWVVKKSKTGREIYENLETGETREEMPEVLFVAEAMAKADKSDEYLEELTKLKEKFKDAELKKREAENASNKARTEINTLRELDRGWKRTSAALSKSLTVVVKSFDDQADTILGNMDKMSDDSRRLENRIPSIKKVSLLFGKMKDKISAQEQTIKTLNAKNRQLQTELDEAMAKVKRLSGGIEEEVERICKPLREKVADAMVQVMREKAARAQERRQMADLWPKTHLMPTLLMQHRALDSAELARRVKRSADIEASKALALEIRKNVSESRKWTTEYDEYGRQFFQHSVTGETEWEQPPIMSYQPPPGRDEMGNLTGTEEDLMKGWVMKCDYRGMVYFESEASGEITYETPSSYRHIPPGRSPELFVGEAANIVLTYIKGKIAKHMGILRRAKAAEKGEVLPEDDPDAQPIPEEEVKAEELSKYMYDIETVESLAEVYSASLAKPNQGGRKGEEVRNVFLDGRADVDEKYEGDGGVTAKEGVEESKENFMGPTLLDVDVTEASFTQIQDIVHLYASMEEKLENRIREVRSNLKDFSFVMVEMLDKNRHKKAAELHDHNEEQRKKEKEERRMLKKQESIRRNEMIRRAESMGLSLEQLQEQLEAEEAAKVADDMSSLGDNSIGEGGDNDDAQQGLEGDEGAGEEKRDDGEGSHLDEPSVAPEASVVSQKSEQKPAQTAETPPPASPGEPALGSFGGSHQLSRQGSGLLSRQGSMSFDGLDQNRSFESSQSLADMPLVSNASGESVLLVMGDPELGLEAAADETGFNYTKEILETANNLVHFSLFCGYNNLRMDQTPDDETYEHSLLDPGDMQDDDSWLTHSFFINITKDQVDGIREATRKEFDPILHSLDSKPLNSLKLIYEAMDARKNEIRRTGDPFTPRVSFVHDGLRREHAMWKSRQLMSEVLKFQIQQEAIKEGHDRKDMLTKSFLQQKHSHMYMAPNPTDAESNTALADMRVLAVEGKGIVFEGGGKHTVYIRFTVGSWTVRTSAKPVLHKKLDWKNMDVCLTLPKLRLHQDVVRVEMFDENALRPDILVGSATAPLTPLMLRQTGEHVTLSFDIADRFDVHSGQLDITFMVDKRDEIAAESVHSSIDENNKVALGAEIASLHSSVQTVKIGMAARDDLSTRFPSLFETQTAFSSLVDDLRGDGADHVRRLIGDIQVDEVLRLGHRVVLSTMKKLPNFKIAINFLETKAKMHFHEVNDFNDETQQLYKIIEEEVEEKLKVINKKKEEASTKYQAMCVKNEGILEEVKKINIKLDEVRQPIPPPKEPVFEPFSELPYIPELPKTTGLDSKGKKKKDCKSADIKTLIVKAGNGELDEVPWDFGERWPNPNQMASLKKACDARNKVMDEDRAKEQAERDRAIEFFTAAYQKWEVEDRSRRNDYERLKKDSRRIYLRLDCVNERQAISQREVQGLEEEARVWQDFLQFHFQCKERVAVMRAKQHMERERQKVSSKNMRRKLLLLLDARRRAYDLPGGAMNEVDYQQFCEKSDIALRTLRFEIVDCKSTLIAEGTRLRNMYDEEMSCLKSELCRARMLREVLRQKNCIDKIVDRHKYEVFNLMEDLEKLKIVEADKDDRGLEHTIDNKGERYIAEKEWTSPAILKTQKMIDLIMSKIVLTEGCKDTAAISQACLFEVMSVKWGFEFAPVRDSWCENSDYERANKQLYDMMQWLALQREKMAEREVQFELIKERAKIELFALQDYIKVARDCHDTETTLITESSSSVIDVVREQMVKKDAEHRTRVAQLEASITELSRECHEVREEKYKQALNFNSKVEALLSLVATLQTTLEHQSAIMDIVKEERDAIVMKTRLAADRLRYQLRLERKHCANLLFIIHAQRAVVERLNMTIEMGKAELAEKERQWKAERRLLRLKYWEQMFAFARLNTNIDDLFEFFAARMANLSGARKSVNDTLRGNGAAVIFAAMCKSPRPLIRKLASRALAGLGWDGYTETRVLMWDCMMQWNIYRDKILAEDNSRFDAVQEHFVETGSMAAVANFEISPPYEKEFEPAPNASLRTIIKQKRQWALRAQRRKEGPNMENMRKINMADGVIPTLVALCNEDGSVDWEIVRNASLAISVASYEPNNLLQMVQDKNCIALVVKLCRDDDPEITTHGAITLANMCHENEKAQLLFGKQNAIRALLDMCQSTIPDVLEAGTAALTNLTCLCDPNCLKFLEENGVADMVKLLTSVRSENFMDTDQNDEVQSNACEILANISRFDCALTVEHFNGRIIDVLILAVASVNPMVRKHCPLILGNISQSEWCRSEIGKRGGIEALFLSLEDQDTAIQANVLWALCNLMWHPPNQERAGRFISDIIPFLTSTFLPVQTNAAILTANVLYYNNPNRVRFLEYEGAMELLVDLVRKNDDWAVSEACLRALLSLSYIDAASLWLGTDGDCVALLVRYLQPPVLPHQSFCTRYALETINNMCVHHTIRRQILDTGGTDSIVALLAHEDPSVQETALQVIALLEDVTPPEVLAKTKKDMGLERMITLTADADPLVRAVAAESVGEEVWKNPAKQKVVNDLGGIESLLGICRNATEALTSLLPALWSLRNCLHSNAEGQMQFRSLDGCAVIVRVLTRCVTGEFGDQSEKVLESCLACLVAAIHNHEQNSRRLLQVGLDILMDLGEGKLAGSLGVGKEVLRALGAVGVVALAKSILSMLAPYNYVVCRNCHKRQNLCGTHCVSCGYLFFVDVSMDGMDGNKRDSVKESKYKRVNSKPVFK